MAFLLERVTELDRVGIREAAIERFSPARMTDRYETIYERSIRAGRRLRTITRPIRSDEPAIVGVGPGVRGANAGVTGTERTLREGGAAGRAVPDDESRAASAS